MGENGMHACMYSVSFYTRVHTYTIDTAYDGDMIQTFNETHTHKGAVRIGVKADSVEPFEV